jgi:hypothetical protein
LQIQTPSLGAIGKRTSTEKIAERMRKFEGKNQQPPPPPPGVLAAPPVQEPPPRRGPQGVGAIASAVAAKAAARRQVSFSDDVDEAPRSGPQGKAKQTAASSTGAAKVYKKIQDFLLKINLTND